MQITHTTVSKVLSSLRCQAGRRGRAIRNVSGYYIRLVQQDEIFWIGVIANGYGGGSWYYPLPDYALTKGDNRSSRLFKLTSQAVINLTPAFTNKLANPSAPKLSW